MQTKYEPQKFEKEIYKKWEEGGYLCHHQILQENYTWVMP